MSRIKQLDEFRWTTDDKTHRVIFYGSRELIAAMDEKVREQIVNVASLPGLVGAAMTMPDAHWGYGFPIGGVAAFDPRQGGIISAGGVGFDISCGIRSLRTNLFLSDVLPHIEKLADSLFYSVPSGVGVEGELRLTIRELEEVMHGGARWAIKKGYGMTEDLDYIEENGCIDGALPENVSDYAKQRKLGEIAQRLGVHLPDRELACAPILSEEGQQYIGAMHCGINCALANRQIITNLTRHAVNKIFPKAHLETLFDVSHNTCKREKHLVNGKQKEVYIHRKGATRAFGPGHVALPSRYQSVGQPVCIGGSMGTGSYVLVGNSPDLNHAFSSACHGAGRKMSRHQALKRWRGQKLINELEYQGIYIRTRSMRGAAEEAPDSYKDVHQVVEATELSGLARRVAFLKPLACVKG